MLRGNRTIAAAASVVTLCVCVAALMAWVARVINGDASTVRGNNAHPIEVVALQRDGVNKVAPRDVSLRGLVQSPTAAPVASAMVCQFADQGEPSLCVITGKDGKFTLGVGTDESMQVAVTADGYLPKILRVARPEADVHLRLVLQPGGVPLSGVVRDAFGAEVPNAMVHVRKSPGSPVLAALRSNEEGVFLAHVEKGSVLIQAHADGFSSGSAYVAAPMSGFAIILAPASSLSGVVIQRDAKIALADITVTAQKRSNSLESEVVTTDVNGHFKFETLSPGSYNVVATGAAWRSSNVLVDVDGTVNDKLLLHADAAGSIHGVVQGDPGACQGGEVRAVGPTSTSALVDDRNDVRINGLALGMYEVTVRCPTHALYREWVDVGSEAVNRTWRLTKGASVQGWVTTLQGTPVEGVEVHVAPRDQPRAPAQTCISNMRGAFSCDGVLPGEYSCYAAKSSSAISASVPVVVSIERAEPVTLQVDPTGAICAEILASDGSMSSCSDVLAVDEKGIEYLGECDGPNKAKFNLLPLRSYTVRIGSGSEFANVQLARAGQVEVVQLRAPMSVTARGRVVNAAGQPVPDAWVEVVSQGATRHGAPTRGLSRSDGTFELTGVAPERQLFTAWSKAGSGSHRADRAGFDNIVLSIVEHGHISGTVTSASGEPVKAFVLTFQGPDGANDGQSVASDAGSWTLPSMPAGEWTIEARAEQGAAHAKVSLKAGERVHLPLTVKNFEPLDADRGLLEREKQCGN